MSVRPLRLLVNAGHYCNSNNRTWPTCLNWDPYFPLVRIIEGSGNDYTVFEAQVIEPNMLAVAEPGGRPTPEGK